MDPGKRLLDAPDEGKPTRASRVSADLKAAILAGDLVPGSKINIDQLRESFGVSLSPMREAIARLVADGLVALEDQRGYSVAPVSQEHLEEVTRLRADLEAMALSRAMDRAGLDWESDALAAFHRAKRAGAENPIRQYDALHKILVGGSGMPLLIGFCETLRHHHLRYEALASYTGAERDLAEEYRLIAEAAIARNAELAPVLLRQQIERTGRAIAARLASRG